MRHETTTLDNGLTLVLVPMPSVHHVVIDAQLRVGPRFETPAENGVSHFLEHMLYRGTPRHPTAHDQALAFESLGGTLAAATYVDHGDMAIGIPPESVDEVLSLFCEVYTSPVFSGIDIERNIVKEEILESLDDDGREVDADNLVRRLTFGEHALGAPITGTLERLDGMDEALLARHHARHYVARSTVLSIAGPIDPDKIVPQVQRGLGELEAGELPAVGTPPADQHEARYLAVRHGGASQTALRVAFRAPAEHDPQEPATEMLLRVLDDGMSTRLYHRICDAKGLCYDVSAAYEGYADAGIFDLAAETEHDRAPKVLSELLSITRELAEHGPTDVELDKAKRRYSWDLRGLHDDAGETAAFFGFSHLTGETRTPEERQAQLLAVTRQQVQAAAQRVFSPRHLNVVAVGLLKKRAADELSRLVAQYS